MTATSVYIQQWWRFLAGCPQHPGRGPVPVRGPIGSTRNKIHCWRSQMTAARQVCSRQQQLWLKVWIKVLPEYPEIATPAPVWSGLSAVTVISRRLRVSSSPITPTWDHHAGQTDSFISVACCVQWKRKVKRSCSYYYNVLLLFSSVWILLRINVFIHIVVSVSRSLGVVLFFDLCHQDYFVGSYTHLTYLFTYFWHVLRTLAAVSCPGVGFCLTPAWSFCWFVASFFFLFFFTLFVSCCRGFSGFLFTCWLCILWWLTF